MGCKADVRRCFDGVNPSMAIRAFEWRGAPPALCRLLRKFYETQQRWVVVRGCVAPEATATWSSLLQGCPWSPILLNALTGIWIETCQPHASRAGQRYDRILGFEMRPNKLEAFALKQGKTELLLEHAEVVEVPQVDFKLLGVRYRTWGRNTYYAGDITEALRERGRRIRLVALGLFTRARLVDMLLLSKFRFLAPWAAFPKKVIRTWTSEVEMTVWGRKPPPGRSAFFVVDSCGRAVPSAFAINAAEIRHEWQRTVQSKGGQQGPQVSVAASAFGWQRLRNAEWDTGRGSFADAEISRAGLEAHMREAWTRKLWTDDTKTEVKAHSKMQNFLFLLLTANTLSLECLGISEMLLRLQLMGAQLCVWEANFHVPAEKRCRPGTT